MTNSEGQHQEEATKLEILAALYPLAFATAAASNSRTGLALRLRDAAGPFRPAAIPCQADMTSVEHRQFSSVGLHPIAKSQTQA